MSLENIGIGGVLSFNGSQAVAGMGSATSATAKLADKQTTLSMAAAKVGGAFSSIGGLAAKASLALAPVTAAFAFAEKYAMDFEKAMSGVKAVAGATSGEMATLTLAAKKFGAKSTFDPIEVAHGMEELARAGFDAKETLTAIPGVLAAAAAEGMPLAQATEIVSTTLRGMGMAADQSTRVADVLALASAKTNASISGLGESMKYAAAQSKIMGIDLETTVGMLGLAADAGLSGSIGGSSFAAMLTKLAKPSKEANHWLKANNIEMKKTATGGLDIVAVVKDINAHIEKETDVMKKGAIMAEVFGDRGKKAFGAIATGISTGKIDSIVADLQNAAGSAQKMADTRLEGVLGTIKQITNAGKALMIEFFGGLVTSAGPTLKMVGEAFGNIVNIVQDLQAGVKLNRAEMEDKYGPTVVAIAYGIVDAIKEIAAVTATVKAAFMDFMQRVTGDATPEMIQSITRIVVELLTIAAILSPILLAFAGVAMTIGAILPVAMAVAEGIGAVFAGLASGPVLVFGAAVGLLFYTMRSEGESIGSVFERMWTMVTSLGHWFMDDCLMPMVNIFLSEVKPAIVHVQKTFSAFVDAAGAEFKSWFGGIYRAMQALAPLFSAIFKILGVIVASFVDVAVTMFGWILQAVTPVLHVVKEVGLWILNVLLKALQKAISFAMQASAALGIDTSGPIWQDLATFASNKIDVVSADGQAQNKAAIEGAGKKPPTMAEREHGNGGADVFAKEAAQNVAMQKAAGASKPNVDVNVDVQDKRSLEIKNCMNVDGRELAVAQGRHKQEINERAGFRATPYQRRQIAEQGAAPVGGVGGS
jgi:TP901 family phage tail tape measure protein